MNYKSLQAKVKEVNENIKVVGVKKEDLIKILNENNIKVEGEKFGYIHEKDEENEVKVKNEENEDEVIFKSLSAHIRYLYEQNMKQSEIAKKLKIRDQFVSNVVRKYKLELSEKNEVN